MRTVVLAMLFGAGLASVGVIARARPASAQSVTRVPSTQACGSCRIRLGDELRLGDDDAGALSRAPIWMAGDAAGYTYVIEEVQEGGPFAFDRTGRFVRKLGGAGGGPGEFRLAMAVVPTVADSLWVFDARAARRSRHAPAPSWEFAGTTPAPSRWAHVAVLRDGRVVINAPFAGSGQDVRSLHVFTREGMPQRSFGEGVIPGRQPGPELDRVLAPSAAGFLAAHRLAYRIDEWTADGKLFRSIVRDAEWFPMRTEDPGVTRTRAPAPTIRAMRLDDRGLLWVLITRAGDQWQRGVGEPSVRVGDVTGWTLLDRIPQRLYKTIVEVIDPRSGRLIVSREVEGYFPWFVGSGRIGGYRTDEDQVPIPVTRALSLEGLGGLGR